MHVKMTPDEPDKLVALVGRVLKIDVSTARERLKNITLGGPGFTVRDGDFTVSIEIPVDPQAKP